MSLDPQLRFAQNDNDVAAKVIDGEAIIMNITTGMYYSSDRVGAVVWDLLQAGYSLEETGREIAVRYDVVEERARTDVDRLAGEFLDENLLRRDPDRNPPAAPPPSTGERLPYEAPEFQKYSDMADLLALDPPMPGLAKTPWAEGDSA